MRRRWATVASVLGIFTAASLAYTWPLAAHLRGAYVYARPTATAVEHGESYLTSWLLAWGAHALRTAPLGVFDANIFHPIRGALAFSEHMLGGALTILPVDVIGRDPVLDHNILLLLSYVLTGAGSALLLRELGTSTTAALVGGALAAFGPWRLAYLGQVHLIASHWMPFTWLFLHRLLRTGRWSAGLAFAVCLALHSLTAVYHAYYFGLAVGVFLALHAALRLPVARGAWVRAALCCVLVGLVVAPTFLPYLAARERFVLGRAPFQTFWFSAVGAHFLGAFMSPLPWLGSRLGTEGAMPAGSIGWGTGLLGILALALGGARGGRRPAALYLTLAFVMALVSLGPVMRMHLGFVPGIPGPYDLLSVIPGWEALRCPARASMSSFLAVAILAGLGADALLSRLRSRGARGAVLALLALLVLADCWRPRWYPWTVPVTGGARAAHAWVAEQAPGVPLVALPFGHSELEGAYMVLSSRHWNPMMNGRSGFNPAGFWVRDVLSRFPDDDSLRLLHDLGVGLVVVHDGLVGRPLCDRVARDWSLYLTRVRIDPQTCILRVLGAPPAPGVPPEKPVPLSRVRMTGSSGESAAAAADGEVSTHWTERVALGADGWLQIDLPEPRALRRIRLRLGSHFGDYPRHYRIDVSADGTRWTPLTPVRLAEPPLRGLRRDPDDLAVDLELPATRSAHVRIVRPTATRDTPIELTADWVRWGVHEVELFEAADTGGRLPLLP